MVIIMARVIGRAGKLGGVGRLAAVAGVVIVGKGFIHGNGSSNTGCDVGWFRAPS